MIGIKYLHTDIAWSSYKETVRAKILETGAKKVLEVGGGAWPMLEEEFLHDHGIDYTILDISEEELLKAPDCYKKIVGDIGSPTLSVNSRYDFVFSRMVAEHLKNGEVFHRNVYTLLENDGRAFHFFPTLWAFPFLVNKLVPEQITYQLLLKIDPSRDKNGTMGKFPAYYSWCFGPTEKQIKRFELIGYTVVEYIGFFGHGGYYRSFPLLLRAHKAITSYLLKKPIPWLTSYTQVTLQKRTND